MVNGGNSVSEVGGGGGGAKLHEFPTLHRSARFTIAYCFTKTTLGHIYCRGRDSACNAITPFFNMLLILLSNFLTARLGSLLSTKVFYCRRFICFNFET